MNSSPDRDNRQDRLKYLGVDEEDLIKGKVILLEPSVQTQEHLMYTNEHMSVRAAQDNENIS